MNFFSFEATRISRSERRLSRPSTHSQQEDRIAQTQPASQHTDVDLVVSIGDKLATDTTARIGQRSAPGQWRT